MCNIFYTMFIVDDADNEDSDVNGSSHGDPVPATVTTTATAPVSAPPSAASVHSGKPTDPDPLVLHVLPSAVSAECECVYKCVCISDKLC